jgi:hypothetical protein
VEAELSGLQARHSELASAHEKLAEDHRVEVERGQAAAAEIVSLTAARVRDIVFERGDLFMDSRRFVPCFSRALVVLSILPRDFRLMVPGGPDG